VGEEIEEVEEVKVKEVEEVKEIQEEQNRAAPPALNKNRPPKQSIDPSACRLPGNGAGKIN
jgi:hypothetical protein